jgi:hypothetical protein
VPQIKISPYFNLIDISRIRSGSRAGSVIFGYRSQQPDPCENPRDPEHCLLVQNKMAVLTAPAPNLVLNKEILIRNIKKGSCKASKGIVTTILSCTKRRDNKYFKGMVSNKILNLFYPLCGTVTRYRYAAIQQRF